MPAIQRVRVAVGRVYRTALVIALLWAVLVSLLNLTGWSDGWMILAPITFGPIVCVLWVGWLWKP